MFELEVIFGIAIFAIAVLSIGLIELADEIEMEEMYKEF